MNKAAILGVAIAVIVVAAIAAVALTGNMGTGNTREFTVHGSRFAFDVSDMTVNQGDTVKINFINDDGLHNICVDGYGCSSTIPENQTTVFQFKADRKGEFDFYCSVGNHREQGMKGDLTVL